HTHTLSHTHEALKEVLHGGGSCSGEPPIHTCTCHTCAWSPLCFLQGTCTHTHTHTHTYPHTHTHTHTQQPHTHTHTHTHTHWLRIAEVSVCACVCVGGHCPEQAELPCVLRPHALSACI